MGITDQEKNYLSAHRRVRGLQFSPDRQLIAFLLERISPFSVEKPTLIVISANKECTNPCCVCSDVRSFAWLSSVSIAAIRQMEGKGVQLFRLDIVSGQTTILELFSQHDFFAITVDQNGILLYDREDIQTTDKQNMGISSGTQFWACAQGYSAPSAYRYQDGKLMFQALEYPEEILFPEQPSTLFPTEIFTFSQRSPICPPLPKKFLVSFVTRVFKAGSYQVQALIASPFRSTEKKPTLIYFPDSDESMETCFEGLHRILCARGFTVVYCFLSLDTACSDVASVLLDRLLDELGTKRQNVILQGTGYGGTVMLRLCQTGSPFSGAIALAPVGNFITHKYLSLDFSKAPDRFSHFCDKYSSYSPLYSIASHHTPTLFLHGKKDYRVWMAESVQLFSSLKLHHIPTRLCLFPNGEHNLSYTDDLITYSNCLNESLAWIEHCMIGGIDNAVNSTP